MLKNVTSGERERVLHLYTATSKLVPKYKLMLKEVPTGYGSERVCACMKVEMKEVMVDSWSMSMATVVKI